MQWLKRMAIAALCLCLCALPVSAETVDGVEKELVPVSGVGETAHMTCPLRLPQKDDSVFALYLEFSGLQQDLWLEANLEGQTIAQSMIEPKAGLAGTWVLLEHPTETVSLELSFYDTQREQMIYQSVAFVLELPLFLPFEEADAIACTPAEELSVLDKEAEVTACLPLGTEDPAAKLYGQLVDKDGTVWGAAAQSAAIVDKEMPDGRFQRIFRENPYKALVQVLETQITLSKSLQPGSYDLIFVDGAGKERYRYPNVVQCADRPAARITGWTAVPGLGSAYAEVTLQLANGAPEDFALELYENGLLRGRSEDYSVLAYEPETGAIDVSYQFTFLEPLEAERNYTAVIDTALAYRGQAEWALEDLRAERGTIYGPYSGFDSAYFANVLLKTTGFTPETQYQAVLQKEDEKLAQCLVTVGEQGWMDIAFTDEAGQPIPVTPGETYRVSLYRWQSGWQWALVDEIQLQSEGAAQTTEDNLCTGAQADGLLAERVRVNDRVTVTDGVEEPLILQLFAYENQTDQPDDSIVLTETQGYTLSYEEADLFSAQRYRSIYLRDGRVIGMDTSGYWVTDRCMRDYWQMQEWGIPNFAITTIVSEHGTFQLLGDDGIPVHHEDCLNFTEIYVHAVPDEGYMLDTISVNGRPITGRAFLLAENSEVSVTFKPRQVETFPIHLRHNSESDRTAGIFYATPKKAALGDLVTLVAQPDETAWLMNIRAFETETGLEIALTTGETLNTWQLVMPGTAITAEVTFIPKLLVEIVVEPYDLTAGRIHVPGFGWEGDLITVTAQADEACWLQELWLVYEQAGAERMVDLLAQPGETSGSYYFQMPGVDKVYIRPVFQERRYTVALPDPMPTGGELVVSHTTARPGSCVTITVIPDEKYRLAEGSLEAHGENQQSILLSPSEKPLTWTFIMPCQNVQILAAFESTEPEVAGITAEQTEDGQWKLAVRVKNPTQRVSLAAALYDGQGRLLGASLLPCSEEEELQQMILSCQGTPAAGWLFFLETDSLVPRTAALSIPLPQ